jgi:group II intron reverse transcriptase/maturase
MRTANTILELIQERGKKRLPIERVYKLLFNQDLFLKAYGKISSNKGAMTHGVTEETPDGMSLKKIDAIIEALRYERYQFLPARRTYIPKKNGKKRPLGMPVWSDKLVQEALRLILEAYFEPQFSDHSHGFRPKRGCHTALREIYHEWKGTTWFIEGDISQCFDKLSHALLIEILKEHIHDGRFIRLMQDLLDAGYMEDWMFNKTLSGVPQGGVVSPILSNILLNKLDTFVETVLIPKYTRGSKRERNKEYERLMKQSQRLRKRGEVEQAEELRKQAQTMPSARSDDPNYRRLRYVRYADDFLLGYTGPKSEAEEIKLELSEEKTLITHARSEAAKFLGYEITVFQNDTKRTKRNTSGVEAMCRSVNRGIGLRMPKDTLEEKCKRYMKEGKAVHRKELEQVKDYEIILTYQLEYRGIVEYYRLAHNIKQLEKLKWIMEYSLAKTLASKHRMTVSKVYENYRARKVVDDREYVVLQASLPRPDKEPLISTWGAIPLKRNIEATLRDEPPKLYGSIRTELERRLLADFCELCGSSEDVEVHHVHAMRKLHEYPGRPKPEWVKRMIALKRKKLILCRRCHVVTDNGLPITWPLISLEEIKERRKVSRDAILESRVR